MYRILATTVALSALCACGDGNPFSTGVNGGTGDQDDPAVQLSIPEDVAGSVTGFTYDPNNQTLALTGLVRDGDTVTVEYNRRPALDQGVYEAYTFQDDPLDEHTTVYVRQVGDVSAATAVTGGQFTFFSGGVNYGRAGGFDPIVSNQGADTGLVTYAGEYIGLSDVSGPNTDLLPAPAVDPSVVPDQAAVVNGRVLINVEFGSNQVGGEVYDRTVNTAGFGTLALPDINFEPSELDAEGNFTGAADIVENGSRTVVGNYGGTIGGVNSTALAGGLYAKEHFGDNVVDGGGNPITFTDEEEYGIFVLGRCGGPLEDASTECSVVDPE